MSLAEPRKPLILCVDDEPLNLKLLVELLSERFDTRIATNGQKALELAIQQKPDLILLDVMMPVMDGFETCRRIRETHDKQDLPILFITAKNQPEDEEFALKIGGNDFITKPIKPGVLQARIDTQLKLKYAQEKIIRRAETLEQEVNQRLSEINHLQDSTIYVMTSLAEFRDECTGNHIRRTQFYVEALSKALAKNPEFTSRLNDETIEVITKSAPLHDIGKIATPDDILLKPGKLTSEEFAIMQTHSERGYKILQEAANSMGEKGLFLQTAQDIAFYHHEKWNGSGYPNGIAGEKIPLAARIMAIADVYDALTSARPYKRAFTQEEAFEIMHEGSGSHFQPILLETFFTLKEQLCTIANAHAD
ncbi:two-component system response regulator [Thiosulfatimonas sediminis]|uniref:Two-component system response regulator n=1 Tax=Thiosulfatimonas sediminis TaxID=2675054 RepID=A0A6F8PSW4_9GAMM|nr:HD domain-containing phosphohydrolase [Thiosulfatimonas sediminis]BBP45223.1 two-component system response regulator [Thiosulfatimonas sediminis]